MYVSQNARITVGSFFKKYTGVQQEDGISSILFKIASEEILRKVTYKNSKKSTLDFAGGVPILSQPHRRD